MLLDYLFFRAWQLLVSHSILHNSPQILDWVDSWPVPGTFQYRDVLLRELSDDTFDQWQERHHAWRSCSRGHASAVSPSLWAISQTRVCGVRENEIQTSGATSQHGTPNHLARWAFHYGYNIFLVKTPTNGHLMWCGEVQIAAWYIRQKTIRSSPQREYSADEVWQSPVSFSSSLLSVMAFVLTCRTSVQIRAGTYYCTF